MAGARQAAENTLRTIITKIINLAHSIYFTIERLSILHTWARSKLLVLESNDVKSE